MKRIIDGVMYDTARATRLIHLEYRDMDDTKWFLENLYMTDNGTFFAVESVGDLVKKKDGDYGRKFQSPKMISVTKDMALEWLDEYDLVVR